MDRNDLFRSAPIPKAVLSLAVPTVISQIITVIYNMADTFFVGQLDDPSQVAAATVSMPLFAALTALANLFGIGGASKMARALGQNDRDTARKSAAFSIWMSIAVAFAYGVLIYFLAPWLLPLLGAKADTYAHCTRYVFWTITIGAVPTVLNAVLAHLTRSEGYAKQAGFGVAMGGVLNIVLDPLFIFAFKLEIAGAAIATMLSNAAAALYFILFLHKKRRETALSLHPRFFGVHAVAGEILIGGLPSFLMMLLSCFSNSVLNRLITAYSTEAMAGMGIAKKIDMIAFAVAQGMTQGVLPLIAYNYASGDRKRMRAAIKTTLLYTLGIACSATAILFLFAGPITRCFIDNDLTVSYGRQFLKVICFTCPSTAVNFMVISVFQATKQKVQPLILSLLRKGSLDIPLMLSLNHFMGLNGIAFATPLADWIALIVSLALFLPFMKKASL